MIDVVCNIDEQYTKYCYIMLSSLVYNNTDYAFTAHIINNGMSDKSKAFLRKLERKNGIKILFYDIPQSAIDSFPIRKQDHLTLATYMRLFMSDLLPDNIDKVLYLDCDLLVVDSIKELWEMDLTGLSVVSVEERVPHNLEACHRLGYAEKYSYFNAGVLLVNLRRWRELDVPKRSREVISQKYSVITQHDQDVLNYLLGAENKFVSVRWNLMDFFLFQEPEIHHDRLPDLKEAIEKPVIIHFNDRRKPWVHNCDNPYVKLYWAYAVKCGVWVPLFGEHFHWHARKILYKVISKKNKYLKLPKSNWGRLIKA